MGVEWANFWVNFALAIITFLAVIVALFQKKLWDWWNKPLIKIGFGNDKPYAIDSYSNEMINLLFRLKAINLGETLAKRCRVKIISVVAEGNENPLIEEPDVLKWSSAPKDMRYYESNQPIHREHIDITPKGGWEFFDLFNINSRERRVIFASTGSRNFLAGNGNYIATIEISGENFEPIRKEIRFSVPHKVDWTKGSILLAGIHEVRNISQSQSDYKPDTSEEPQHLEQSPSENEDK